MSALDTAKEIARIGTTAGLSKDVVDLLERKSSLLTEQVASLERENTQLKAEVAELRQRLQRSQPPGLVENDGLLWKRTDSGFERSPHCPVCSTHPVMMEFPPGSREMWVCPANHTFGYDSTAPKT